MSEQRIVMKCKICDRHIEDYDPEFNRMEITESFSVDICQDCIDRFMKWQGSRIARLFPTKAMKKMMERKGRLDSMENVS